MTAAAESARKGRKRRIGELRAQEVGTQQQKVPLVVVLCVLRRDLDTEKKESRVQAHSVGGFHRFGSAFVSMLCRGGRHLSDDVVGFTDGKDEKADTPSHDERDLSLPLTCAYSLPHRCFVVIGSNATRVKANPVFFT